MLRLFLAVLVSIEISKISRASFPSKFSEKIINFGFLEND